MQFTRCLREYRIQYQDIIFISRTKRLQLIEKQIKKLDPINLEDLLFIYLFNKKFENLLEKIKQDYKINLLDNVPKKLNVKFYTMIVKKDKVLNQQLKE